MSLVILYPMLLNNFHAIFVKYIIFLQNIVKTFEIEEALIKPMDVLKDRQNIQESSQISRQGKGKGKKSKVIS